MAKPFMLQIQPNRLSTDEQGTFKRLLAKYLEGSGVPKDAAVSAASGTLSN